jgi:negative regulator of genetic competence, sporulation and motility
MKNISIKRINLNTVKVEIPISDVETRANIFDIFYLRRSAAKDIDKLLFEIESYLNRELPNVKL